MTKIKICGLFREEDINYVNEAKPDFIGFVFAKSHRQVSKEISQKLKKKLSKEILSVGVFVNEDINKIVEFCKENIIDLVQLHGEEDEKYISNLKKVCNKKIIKVVKVKTGKEIIRLRNSQADWLMFDAGKGEGRTFDWNILKNFIRPYFLAGGLHPGNAAEAVRNLHPYAVDVSSGVETGGVKDNAKMAAFISAVRKEDNHD